MFKKLVAVFTSLLMLTSVFLVSASAADSGDRIVIRFENHGANKHELFSEAVQIFNNSQDEIYVEFQTNTTDWEASFWASLAVNDAPDIITHIAQSKIKRYVDAGHLYDLSPLECSKYILEEAKEAVSYENGIYAIPVQTEIYGIFYNKDIFEKAGIQQVPTTITELEQVIEKLKPLEAEGIYPFAAQYRDQGQLGFIFTYGASGTLYKSIEDQNLKAEDVAEGKFDFRNDRIKNALKIYDLIRNNSQPRPEDTDYTTHNSLFAAGETAMLVMGNWMISQMRELNPEINVGMFPVPVSEDPSDAMFAADYNLVMNVNAHTQQIEAVDKFLSFFCDYQKPTNVFFQKNALPSGIKDFEKIVVYDAALEAPLSAEITSKYFTRTLPTGLDLGKCVQEYMLDKSMTIDQLTDMMQDEYLAQVESLR